MKRKFYDVTVRVEAAHDNPPLHVMELLDDLLQRLNKKVYSEAGISFIFDFEGAVLDEVH